MTPGAPSSPCCKGRPRWPRRTAPAPWTWRTSSLSSCAPPKNALETLRPRPRISGTAPRAPKPGCSASIMKSRTPFSRRKSASRASRSGNEGRSFADIIRAAPAAASGALAACALIALAAIPAPAMAGGATFADQMIARHVVLILGGHSLCSGVAIAADLVLTAAHCVSENGKYRLVVFEGRRAIVKDAAQVVAHPQYSPRADAPDIALIKLTPSASSKLSPAAFSDRRAPPSVGERFVVAGFG